MIELLFWLIGLPAVSVLVGYGLGTWAWRKGWAK